MTASGGADRDQATLPWTKVDLIRLTDVLNASGMTLGQLLDEMREAALHPSASPQGAPTGS